MNPVRRARSVIVTCFKSEIWGLALLAVVLAPSLAGAQGIAINHDPTIECFPVGKYTLVRAVFPEGVRIAAKVDAFVVDVVQELDPASPPPTINRCSAAKKKCVSKKAVALLNCYRKGATRGQVADPVCITKAQTKFDGGAVPANGCFREARGEVRGRLPNHRRHGCSRDEGRRVHARRRVGARAAVRQQQRGDAVRGV